MQVTRGEGIEHDPVVLPSGKHIAALTADWRRPQSVAIFPAADQTLEASAQKVIYPLLTKVPRTRTCSRRTLLARRTDSGSQSAVPAGTSGPARSVRRSSSSRRPVRQMLLGYHYMESITSSTASISGCQPGLHRPLGELPRRRRIRQVLPDRAEYQPRGNSEYRTLAAGSTCRRADVDPARRHLGVVYGAC